MKKIYFECPEIWLLISFSGAQTLKVPFFWGMAVCHRLVSLVGCAPLLLMACQLQHFPVLTDRVLDLLLDTKV